MNELISTSNNESGEILVSGRELHEFLEVSTPYPKWFDRMVDYGFVGNIDFVVADNFVPNSRGGKQTQIDHQIKLDMAKEISMIQRTEKGKKARQYFLELERKWNSPEMIIKRAHELLEKQVAALTTNNLVLEQQVQEFKPKASYYDTVLQNKSLLSITRIAKDYGMSGTKS